MPAESVMSSRLVAWPTRMQEVSFNYGFSRGQVRTVHNISFNWWRRLTGGFCRPVG